MLKVTDAVITEYNDNAGCTNGNHHEGYIELSDGSKLETSFCRCGHGCNGTTPMNCIGMEFDSVEQFWDWFNGYLEIG